MRYVLLFLFFITITSIKAQTMYVAEKNGSQSAFPLGSIRKLTFSGGNIILKKHDGYINTYLLTSLRYLSFYNLSTEISFNEIKESDRLYLFPNPVEEILIVNYPDKICEMLSIDIVSMQGVKVYSNIVKHDFSGNQIEIDVSLLAKGLYVVVINNGKSIVSGKFLKN